MTPDEFGKALEWGKGMDAKPWTDQLKNNPDLGKTIIDKLQERGITKDQLGEWSKWYGERYQDNPSAEQFRYRSEGLEQLRNMYPGVGVFICPAGSQCS